VAARAVDLAAAARVVAGQAAACEAAENEVAANLAMEVAAMAQVARVNRQGTRAQQHHEQS